MSKRKETSDSEDTEDTKDTDKYAEKSTSHTKIKSSIGNTDKKPYQRKRAFSKRSKSGCLTCRERRIKCDEYKPVCKNCVKSRRACAYPNPDIKKQQKFNRNYYNTNDNYNNYNGYPKNSPISSNDLNSKSSISHSHQYYFENVNNNNNNNQTYQYGPSNNLLSYQQYSMTPIYPNQQPVLQHPFIDSNTNFKNNTNPNLSPNLSPNLNINTNASTNSNGQAPVPISRHSHSNSNSSININTNPTLSYIDSNAQQYYQTDPSLTYPTNPPINDSSIPQQQQYYSQYSDFSYGGYPSSIPPPTSSSVSSYQSYTPMYNPPKQFPYNSPIISNNNNLPVYHQQINKSPNQTPTQTPNHSPNHLPIYSPVKSSNGFPIQIVGTKLFPNIETKPNS